MTQFADRGKAAEKAVKVALERWADGRADREVDRLMDTRAAGRVVKSAAADFAFYDAGRHGLLEVKSTEHDYRLSRTAITQIPRLRKREMCGGVCLVLVYHSSLNVWRCVPVSYLMETGDKGSWNLSDVKSFASAGAALADTSDVFSCLRDTDGRTRYCHYCRKHKAGVGFKVITSLFNGTVRHQCADCAEVRSSKEALAAKAREDEAARRRENAERTRLSVESKRAKRMKDHT